MQILVNCSQFSRPRGDKRQPRRGTPRLRSRALWRDKLYARTLRAAASPEPMHLNADHPCLSGARLILKPRVKWLMASVGPKLSIDCVDGEDLTGLRTCFKKATHLEMDR